MIVALFIMAFVALAFGVLWARAGAQRDAAKQDLAWSVAREEALSASVNKQALEHEAELEKVRRSAETPLRVAPLRVEVAVATTVRPEWTQEDAEAFRIFMGTAVGRKVGGILLFDEQKQNRSAVLRVANHEYNAGFAAGFHARSESLLELSADVRPQQDEDSGERDGATPLAERAAP